MEWLELYRKLTMSAKALRIAVLIGVVVLAIITFVWLNAQTAQQLKTSGLVADAFSKFAIGFGAIATGIGGLGLIEEWLKKQDSRDEQHKSDKARWNKQYPSQKYKVTYRLIQGEGAEGVLYVQDLPGGSKHWIANPETLRDLNMDYSQVETIPSSDFQKIPSAGIINTKAS